MRTSTRTSKATSQPAKAAKGNPPRPNALGATARRRVETCIDDFLYFSRFQLAIKDASRAGNGPIRPDDLPEPFRSDYDPETDTQAVIDSSVEAYSIELSKCFYDHCGGAGIFPIFLDVRNGWIWVQLPPGLCFSPDYTTLAKHPRLDPREWSNNGGNFVVFEAGRGEMHIPKESLEWAGCELGIVIHEDGTVTLSRS